MYATLGLRDDHMGFRIFQSRDNMKTFVLRSGASPVTKDFPITCSIAAANAPLAFRSGHATQPDRQIRIVHEVDVVVAGAGVSGLGAVLEATRKGTGTVLIARYLP